MIEARDICVSIKGRVILDRVCLVAQAGAITIIAGPNGAGKSTVLKVLAGLITPNSGCVLLDGRSTASIAAGERATLLAYLPQDRDVHWPLDARAIVGLGRLAHLPAGVAPGQRDHDAIDAAMRATDVVALADRAVTELSGGERARVLMARALAQEPRVLIADEPTAGLDPAHQLQLFQHLRSIAARGVGVVVALHDLSLAARFGDAIVLMKAGQIAASGRPADVLTARILSPVYGVSMLGGQIDGVPVLLPGELLP